MSFLLLLGSAFQKASAQEYYFYNDKYYDNPIVFNVGVSIGAMNCLTDIGGNKGIGKKFVKDLNFGATHPAFSVTLGAIYKDAIGFRLEYTNGKVSAKDSYNERVKETTFGRYERNLSFRSKISEFAFLTEIFPMTFFRNPESEVPRISPYLLGGIGYFTFNPQAKLNGKWIDLQPLSTEGQGFSKYPDKKKYKLNQVNFPVGLGLQYELGDLLFIRGEFIYRKLNTDYLDDASTTYIDPIQYQLNFTGAKQANALLLNARQKELDPTFIVNEGDQRANPGNKDAYFSFNLKIAYSFGRERIKR